MNGSFNQKKMVFTIIADVVYIETIKEKIAEKQLLFPYYINWIILEENTKLISV